MIYNYYLGLGSNIEPRLNFLQSALKKLAPYGRIRQKSSIYNTRAWGNTQQDDFYNASIEFDSPLNPHDLLAAIKKIEQEIGRRESGHWAPREIDIDILYCRNLTMREAELTIPHPLISERRFVLEPLTELEENLSIDETGIPIRDLLLSCQDFSPVSKLDIVW